MVGADLKCGRFDFLRRYSLCGNLDGEIPQYALLGEFFLLPNVPFWDYFNYF